MIVINKCDLVSETDAERLEGIIHHLNPDARLLRVSHGGVELSEVIGTGLYDEGAASQKPGWAKELEGDHTPETEEYGIGSFVYRRRRPFHPQRLMAAIGTGLDGVVRSKDLAGESTSPLRRLGSGGCIPSDRSRRTGSRRSIRSMTDDPETREWIDSNWDDEVGDCRQEIVLIGVGMDQQRIEYILDDAGH